MQRTSCLSDLMGPTLVRKSCDQYGGLSVARIALAARFQFCEINLYQASAQNLSDAYSEKGSKGPLFC